MMRNQIIFFIGFAVPFVLGRSNKGFGQFGLCCGQVSTNCAIRCAGKSCDAECGGPCTFFNTILNCGPYKCSALSNACVSTSTTTITTLTSSTPTTAASTTTPLCYICPDTMFTLSGSSCFHVSSTTSTWADASPVCEALGATLATIETADEDITILGMMTADTWTGLNDHSAEGSFIWQADSTSLTSYTNWYGSNPRVSSVQNCVVKKVKQEGKWDDVGCNKDLPAACRMDAVPSTDCTTTTIPTLDICLPTSAFCSINGIGSSLECCAGNECYPDQNNFLIGLCTALTPTSATTETCLPISAFCSVNGVASSIECCPGNECYPDTQNFMIGICTSLTSPTPTTDICLPTSAFCSVNGVPSSLECCHGNECYPDQNNFMIGLCTALTPATATTDMCLPTSAFCSVNGVASSMECSPGNECYPDTKNFMIGLCTLL